MRGKLVVVGGHSRGVGKTSIMNIILGAMPEMDWHAVKISSHRHSTCPSPVATGSPELLRLPDNEFAFGLAGLKSMLEDGRNLLVESNRIVAHLDPDVLIFVVDPLNPDWKATSALCLKRADALVFSNDGSLALSLPAFRLLAWDRPPLGFAGWLRERLLKLSTPPVRGANTTCPAPRCVGQCGEYQRTQSGGAERRECVPVHPAQPGVEEAGR